ncbi:hypothetical protein [Paenibacillus amylolyticus]|uniref:hypothetical protein n=1 Tax=Paenibacillus amylolyticus TaxID=1451 RepID=UPI003D996548
MPVLDSYSLDNYRIDGSGIIDPANLKYVTGNIGGIPETGVTIGNLALTPLFMSIYRENNTYNSSGQLTDVRSEMNLALSATNTNISIGGGRNAYSSHYYQYQRDSNGQWLYGWQTFSMRVVNVVFGTNSVTLTGPVGGSNGGSYIIYGI